MPKKERGRPSESGPELRFLILEDAVADAELCEAELKRAGLRFRMHRVETRADFEAELARSVPDLIISDFTFPGGFDGFAALEIARSKLPDVPFVFVSGTIGEERAVEAIQRGAADYVLKDRMSRLGPAVRHVLERRRLLREKDQAEAALQASEERLRLFVEHAPAAIAMVDRDMKYLAVSRRWLADYRMAGRNIIGLSHYEVFPEVPERWKEIHRRCLAGVVEKSEEDTFPRTDGSMDWVRWEIHPWRRDGGEIGGVILFSELITERKLQQQKIDRLSRIHALLSGINAAIVRAGNRQELLDASCRIAVEHGGFGIAWIGKVDPATLDVTPIAWAGIGPEHFTRRTSARTDVAGGRGMLGTAIRERRPVWIGDLAANPALGGQRREEALRRGYRSLIALPLFIGGEVAGSLSLFAQEANYFNDEEVRLLAELAGNISFALESFAREEKIERLSRIRSVTSAINAAIVHAASPQALFEEACRIAVEQGRLGSAWIGIIERATLDIVPVALAGEGAEEMRAIRSSARATGAVSLAVRERRVVVNNHLAHKSFGGPRRDMALRLGFNSMVALPLFEEPDVVGTFTLYAREPGYFDEGEITLLTELAGNVSFALEHMARQQRIGKLSRIRAFTSGINAAILRSRSRQDLFDETCRIAIEHGGFGIAWIGELDRHRAELVLVASAGLNADTVTRAARSSSNAEHPMGRGVAGQAVRERKVIFVNDIQAEPGPMGIRRSEAIRLGYRSRIALPLLIDGEVCGVIVLYAEEKGFFTDEELKLLTELAGNLSFALEHMRRLQQIDKLSRIRAVSSEINSAIVRSHKKHLLFYEACRIAVEHGKFGIAWIGEFDAAKLEITPVASAGLSDDDFLTHNKLAISRDTSKKGSLIAAAIHARRAACNNDIVADAEAGGERRKEAIRRGYRSAIALPLIVEGAVTNTFSLFVKEANFFDDEEVALLTELAGNLSFALDNIARQAKLDKLSRIRAISSGINAAIARIRDRDALLKEISRIAAEQGKFEMIWIATINHEKREVRPVTWTGFSEEIAQRVNWKSITSTQGTLGEAVRTQKPAVRDDIEAQLPMGGLRQEAIDNGCLSTVCLPIVVDGEVTALISLFANGRGFFDQDEMTILDEVAPNISFALESIARQEKIERLSRIRRVLGEINGAIARTRDRQKLFDAACHIAVEAGGLTFAWIGVVERDPLQVRPAAWAGVEDPILSDSRSPRPLDEQDPGGPGPFAVAVLQKKPVVVNDVQHDERIQRKQDHLERNINSIAMLPLLVDGEAAGVLGLHARETGFFDEEEMRLLSELAGDIALALQTIAKQDELDYLSYYDPLTGLPNRTLFIDRTGQQMRARSGEPRMVALILINLERFRYINETFGRNGGDMLLKQVAQRLEAAFNGKDYLARIGADSFGLVMRGIRDAAAVVHAVENLALDCFRDPYRLDSHEVRVAAKAGIALFPADGDDADALFRNAEAALKKARESGERYLFYAAEMNARAAHVLSLETRLRKAVEAQQFVLHYQPKIELVNDRICGLEALIRWQETEAELVPPASFIPLLEETGLILDVGKWALGQALADCRAWTARGRKVPRIAVNVSAIQLQQKDFADMVINAVQEQGGSPESLELEVTESLLMRDVEASIHKLSLLRGLGIHIAMDDFGTGYSSLSYIARLPINLVKIDRSFISGMANSPQDMAIVTTIIALAHSLNLRVVAEGVETESQSRLLKLLKCDEAQGYLFSKPLPAAEIEALLNALA